CRPQSILPHHPELDLDELLSVLRRTPADLAIEFMDYILWRGVRIDGETRQLVRRTIELSSHIRTVSGLARAMYLSRRALGRRFMTRGIPVPSHWLHIARILRASLRLQAGDESLMTIAYDLGYSDGFAFSNQMRRLTGLRPSAVRRAFGWEWIVEAWLTRELASGGFSSRIQHRLTPPPMSLLKAAVSKEPDRTEPVPQAERVGEFRDRHGGHSATRADNARSEHKWTTNCVEVVRGTDSRGGWRAGAAVLLSGLSVVDRVWARRGWGLPISGDRPPVE
ncbi:MAG: helix-turn-helix domain-containing protein, partial [Longimicrobiales bacterium]